MRSVETREAVRNRQEGRPYSIWSTPSSDVGQPYENTEPGNGGYRAYSEFPDIQVKPKFGVGRGARFFATGSCFAREIEFALHGDGHSVLSWNPSTGIPNEQFHRYNTFSIINDFQYAFGEPYSRDNLTRIADDSWADWSGYGFFPSESALFDMRQQVIRRHGNLVDAHVLILTLGLVEAWYDRQVGRYLNIAPYNRFRHHADRYELHVTTFDENLRALMAFEALIRKVRSDIKVVVTVSPVPLSDTFSGQDVIVANCYSKSVLRAVAQEWASQSDLIDYYPSYEMVTLGDPSRAWFPDRRHVRREYVAEITSRFLRAYQTA